MRANMSCRRRFDSAQTGLHSTRHKHPRYQALPPKMNRIDLPFVKTFSANAFKKSQSGKFCPVGSPSHKCIVAKPDLQLSSQSALSATSCFPFSRLANLCFRPRPSHSSSYTGGSHMERLNRFILKSRPGVHNLRWEFTEGKT
jgi:hypothetical protein